MNNLQIDDAKDIVIGPNGRLWRNGTESIIADVDDDTGLNTFLVSSDTTFGTKDTRFVHVEVYRHFGPNKPCPFLEAEDVEFLNDQRPDKYHITNLLLTESGMGKVYDESVNDGSVNVLTTEEGESVKGESVNVLTTEEGESVKGESVNVLKTEEGESVKDESVNVLKTEEGETEIESDDDVIKKVFKTEKRGGYYDVVDPMTGDSVLEVFGRTKLIQGKKNVVKFAEKNLIEIEIV